MTADLEQFVALVAAGQRDAAALFALDALAAGARVDDVVCGVLVPAQELVGERWLRNEWTVAQEHAATAIVESVLTVLVTRAGMRDAPERTAGEVVVCCAPGEEHTLPPRMLSELLRARGRTVTFLGGATTPGQLGRQLEELSRARSR